MAFTDRRLARSIPRKPIVSTENLDIMPADDMVLLELVQSGDQTEAGIVLPQVVQASMMPRWRVAAVGPGRLSSNGSLIPLRAQVGDICMVSPERGQMFEVPGRSVKTMIGTEGVIIATLRERSAVQ